MADKDRVTTFLKECSSYMSQNTDNSLNVPLDIRKKYQRSVDVDEEWRNYLKSKFSYLLRLKKDPETADEKTRQELRSSDKTRRLERFISKWRQTAKKEELAYKYRHTQLPESIVHDRWYWRRIQECVDWCKACEDELGELEENSRSKPWQEVFANAYSSIAGKPSTSFHDEMVLTSVCKHALQCFTKSINKVHSHLSKGSLSLDVLNGTMLAECQEALNFLEHNYKNLQIEETTIGYVPLGDDFLNNLAIKLMEVLYEEEFDETALIRQFLFEIRNKFNCEVCDYLDVSEDQDAILWRIATTDPEDLSEEYRKLLPDEARPQVQQYESYSKGEGISGSILLLQDADIGWNTWHHVGSNDVLADPRRSEKKQSAYETDMYPGILKVDGQIHNFWAFPIYRASKLVAAFRVVNRLTEDGKEFPPGGWSYHTKVQIALVAQWFSRFLEAAQPQIYGRADWTEVFKRKTAMKEMTTRLGLNWIDSEKLRGLLRHLARDIGKKQEGRRAGCCIMVVDVASHDFPFPDLEAYPLLNPAPGEIRYPYDRLDIYHDVVNPLKGAYVFDQNGEFVRIASLHRKDNKGNTVSSGIETIRSVTRRYEKSLCLMLTREGKNVQVYKGGNRIAEIYISESIGEWRFRYPQDILEVMEEKAPDCDRNVLKLICDTCVELSNQGHGSIIVVGDIPTGVLTFKQTGPQNYRLFENLKSIGESFFAEIIKSEGATFVENNGVIAKVNSIVRSNAGWEPRKLFVGRGARHDTGEMISRLAPNAMVIIISANGDISIVSDGGGYVKPDL